MRSGRPQVLIFEAEAKSALPVATSFAARGFRVVAASSRKYCSTFYYRKVHERIRMPSEMLEPDACLEFLLDLVRRRHFEMMIPLGDTVCELVGRRRDEFMRHTRLVLVPPEIFQIGRDKVETMKAAQRAGVPIPRTWYPEEQDIGEISREAVYPVLVKPAVASGARGIEFVHSAAELRSKYDEISGLFGRTYVQEFIPPPGMQYKADLILDYDQTLLAGVVYSKIRYYPPSAGSSVLNESVDYPEILDYATRLARHIGWFGLCDFDFIVDARDNTPKLMEINPRFPESFRMCEAAGVDFTAILHDMAMGRRIEPQLGYQKGRFLRFLPGDVMWFLTMRGSRRTQPGFFEFFDGKTTYQLLHHSDAGPMLGYLLENLMVMLDPREREFRLRLRTARSNGQR